MEVETVKIKWGQEADVIVAGFGGAGACAAIAAHDAGALTIGTKTTALRSRRGGSSPFLQ